MFTINIKKIVAYTIMTASLVACDSGSGSTFRNSGREFLENRERCMVRIKCLL